MRLINKNLAALNYAYKHNYRGVVMEGSSRSGKTIAAIDFHIKLASQTKSRLVFNDFRETYNSFKTTLYDDWYMRLNAFNLPSPFINKEVPSFKLLNSKVNLIGADKIGKAHGMGTDHFYMNEVLEGITKEFFNQLEQRCRGMWWMDYNPSASDHWVFDLEKRSDVLFVKSTFLDNPYVPLPQKIKILSYDPNNPINIENGTADDYMWKVYGLGLRASPQGLIFPNVTVIDELPEGYDNEWFGIDFGYTNHPTAIVQVRRVGRNLYAKLHVYQPIDNAEDIYEVASKICAKGNYYADSADPIMIAKIRRKGLNIFPVPKPPGSIKAGIDTMKEFKLHVVRDPDVIKEVNNYKWRMINGISLNEPIDAFNHFWDAFRYAVMFNCIT